MTGSPSRTLAEETDEISVVLVAGGVRGGAGAVARGFCGWPRALVRAAGIRAGSIVLVGPDHDIDYAVVVDIPGAGNRAAELVESRSNR